MLADSILYVLLVCTAEQSAWPVARAGVQGRHATPGRRNRAGGPGSWGGGRVLVDQGGGSGRAWPGLCLSCLMSTRGASPWATWAGIVRPNWAPERERVQGWRLARSLPGVWIQP